VARRRYGKPSPAISTAGRAAQPRDPTGDEQPIEPRSEYGKPPPEPAAESSQHFSTGLKDWVQQQRTAPDPLEHYIAQAFPGALPHERQWLRANPHHLQNPMLIHATAQYVAQQGIARHDPQFLHFVGQLLDQHHAAQAQPAPAAPMPPQPPTTHVDLESHDTEPEAEPVPSHHVSAPVSREAGHAMSMSGEPPPLTPGQVRLSAEERDMAHRSMPHLSHDEAERTYAAGVLKRDKMKRSKLLSD
jgi:hypothetical protein